MMQLLPFCSKVLGIACVTGGVSARGGGGGCESSFTYLQNNASGHVRRAGVGRDGTSPTSVGVYMLFRFKIHLFISLGSPVSLIQAIAEVEMNPKPLFK